MEIGFALAAFWAEETEDMVSSQSVLALSRTAGGLPAGLSGIRKISNKCNWKITTRIAKQEKRNVKRNEKMRTLEWVVRVLQCRDVEMTSSSRTREHWSTKTKCNDEWKMQWKWNTKCKMWKKNMWNEYLYLFNIFEKSFPSSQNPWKLWGHDRALGLEG